MWAVRGVCWRLLRFLLSQSAILSVSRMYAHSHITSLKVRLRLYSHATPHTSYACAHVHTTYHTSYLDLLLCKPHRSHRACGCARECSGACLGIAQHLKGSREEVFDVAALRANGRALRVPRRRRARGHLPHPEAKTPPAAGVRGIAAPQLNMVEAKNAEQVAPRVLAHGGQRPESRTYASSDV